MVSEYRPCVRVIILKEGKVLLGKRKYGGEFKHYEFPGGGVEKGYSPEETVVKECLEEVGIRVDNIRELGYVLRYPVSFYKKEKKVNYIGNVDKWYVADYVREDRSLYGDDRDQFEYLWKAPGDAVEAINKGPRSPTNSSKLKALSLLIERFSGVSNKCTVSRLTQW